MDAPRFEAECAIRHGKDSANERHGKEKNKVFFVCHVRVSPARLCRFAVSAKNPRPEVRVSNERHGKEKNEVFSMSCPSAARSARRFFQDIYGWLLLRLDRFGIIAFIQVSVVYRIDFQSGNRAAYMSGYKISSSDGPGRPVRRLGPSE